MASYDWVPPSFLAPPAPPAPPPAEGEAAQALPPPPPSGRGESFVVFDLETTGLEAAKGERIAEIGAIKFDWRGPAARFSTLVDPGKPMPPGATKVNGITDAMLQGKPRIEEVLPDFLAFIGDCPLVAHNASFDVGFVNAALAALYKPVSKAADPSQGSLLDAAEEAPAEAAASWTAPFPALPNKVVDTLAYAKEAFPGRYKYSLQELAKWLMIESLDAHRAEDDARVCMELFVRCVDKSAGLEVPTAG